MGTPQRRARQDTRGTGPGSGRSAQYGYAQAPEEAIP